ncbi:MAG: hypothetical protein MUF04_04870 [Akkermansiaceae bacterium]|jgi:hypothetical protein|nr:hypothetical protein [Akkermansiaceae bacterium]
MPLQIDRLIGKVFVDEQPVNAPREVGFENCVTIGANSAVTIFDGPAAAATLVSGSPPVESPAAAALASGSPLVPSSGTAPQNASGSRNLDGTDLTIYSPPVIGVSLMYYRRSYRTQIGTPGGSVGIRV